MSMSHICTFALDPVKPESEFQAQQAQGVFRGPQASRGEDTNLDWSMLLSFILKIYFMFYLIMY
jgi:hypothetical protein